MRIVILLISMALCVYGLLCAWRMGDYIGTGHYWTNPWFYKAHACLFAAIALRLIPVRRARGPSHS